MKRIGILTAGGDTPAAPTRPLPGRCSGPTRHASKWLASSKGSAACSIRKSPTSTSTPSSSRSPKLDPTRGGTILGASRDYVDSNDVETIGRVAERLKKLKIDGLVCVGGDGTINGMQPLGHHLPVVLAPKTIDNDLGLNYRDEASDWYREPDE